MGPEFWVVVGAAFIGGGALGSAGTLFARWLFKQLEVREEPRRALAPDDMALLRADLHDMARHVHNLDARLDFQERLIGGSLAPAPAPGRLQPADTGPEPSQGGGD